MRVAVYTLTRDRLPYTRKSLKALRVMAGLDFDYYVGDNGSGADTREYLVEQAEKGRIHTLQLHDENIGQNLAANALLDEMGPGYDWIVRWDNDMIPRTRRFLAKLLRVGERCKEYGVIPVLTPTITKLKFPPPALRMVDMEELELEQIGIAGGMCRAHTGKMFEDFRYNKFAPLGFGEANEMANFCEQTGVPILRVPGLEVEHLYGEDKQIEENPDEFTWERRDVGRYVGYGL